MQEDEKQGSSKTIKQRIRERYKGIDEDLLDVIPAIPQEDFYRSQEKKRVAVYARVSTDDPNQTSSYELQKNHYEDMVTRRGNWELVGIYADEGISGTSLQHRDNFIRMINDCHAGKIDLIVTKSVSRFARNIIDCIGYVRQLKAQDPPIGVFFETENIYTLDKNSEMSLSFIATLAQEESHTKSEIMNASIEMRFHRGIFLTPVLLGYDHDEEGHLIVNEEEAKVIRLIFFSYLYGYSTQQIADALTELACLTKKGNDTWSAGSVAQILSNERYCGDVLARKTFTPDYLNHKSKKNRYERNQYRQKNHHEAIITREDFFAVQRMLRNAKYGNKGYFPEMPVMKTGILKGYVTIHPKWAGFSVEDYYMACDSIGEEEIALVPSRPLKIELKKGNIDLSGYELVRRQFLSTNGQISVVLTNEKIVFNKSSLLKIPETNRIELLIMPYRRMLAVRRARTNSRYGLVWCKSVEEKTPRGIGGSAFLPTLFKLLGWREEMQYKAFGNVIEKDTETILLFDLKEACMMIDPSDFGEIGNDSVEGADNGKESLGRKGKKVRAYPASWAQSFGEEYYTAEAVGHEIEEAVNEWTTDESGTIYRTDTSSVTTQSEAARQMNSIIRQMGETNE